MKKLFNKRILTNTVILLVATFLFIITGCEQAEDIIQSVQNVTPVAYDFTITGVTAIADDSPKIVNIKPKTGKSQGAITVYYEGINGTFYPKSANAPSAAGKYAVTFDVAAAEGFNSANGLKAGTLTINAKITGNIEIEDEDNTNDDNTNENNTDDDTEETNEEPSEEKPEIITENITEIIKEEIIEINNEVITEEKPEENTNEIKEETTKNFIFIDFEDGEWTKSGYSLRTVNWDGYEWTVCGNVTNDANDHKTGNKCIRLRGDSSQNDTGEKINRIELMNYLTKGIKSISFDYASYGTHEGGIIILYYQKENDNGNWVEAGEVTAPAWSVNNKMQNALFLINETGNIRFKIEKVSVKSNKASVNVDNIAVTTY